MADYALIIASILTRFSAESSNSSDIMMEIGRIAATSICSDLIWYSY